MKSKRDVQIRLFALGSIASPVVEVLFNNDEVQARLHDQEELVNVPVTHEEWSYFYNLAVEGKLSERFR
jgi:hypothetical protein